MSGHMGAETVTQRGLVVVDCDPSRNLLLVSGSVPGATGSLLYVREDR
jgi:large subunit ribosomal protein L3